jgi:hypothetical protein
MLISGEPRFNGYCSRGESFGRGDTYFLRYFDAAISTVVYTRVLYSGYKIRRENLWLVYLQPTTNHQPEVLPPYFAARKKNLGLHPGSVKINYFIMDSMK